MGSKKTTATAAGLPALKIGSRIRRTDDLAEGRIVWANGVSVKITWDDGEQVTWRRDSLAGRPIEILAGDEDQPTPAAAPDPTEPPVPETPSAAPESAQEPFASETPPFQPTTAETPPTAAQSAQEPPAAALPASESTTVDPLPAAAEAQETVPTEAPGSANERKRRRVQKAASATAKKEQDNGKDKKTSAIDAAAKVLAETGAPMSCKEMIGAMAGKGYWTSPGGKTPDATLCSAILREIKVKGEQSQFIKVGPGRFARRSA
jgi:hypothetical protein